MKCPKCGYNSFEFLDNCKKCGSSLVSFKKNFGISPIVFAPNRSLMERHQPLSTDVPHEEGALTATPVVPSDDNAEDTFTWDIPALAETAPETGTTFSGFDLDFIKEDAKPDTPETDFSFGEEPDAESPEASNEETGVPFEDFSFYEETLELGKNPPFAGSEEELQEAGSDPFGETGVMGEILPEQLQAGDRESEAGGCIDDFPLEPEKYQNEFAMEDFSDESGDAGSKEEKAKRDSSDLLDFEKEFESIFQTDETSDTGKAGN